MTNLKKRDIFSTVLSKKKMKMLLLKEMKLERQIAKSVTTSRVRMEELKEL